MPYLAGASAVPLLHLRVPGWVPEPGVVCGPGHSDHRLPGAKRVLLAH